MIDNKKVIFADNVAIIQSQDGNSQLFHTISTVDFYKFTGDITGTIEIRPIEMVEKKNIGQLHHLFGAWAESGAEEKELEELFNSRLLPSSIPEQ
jgi:hypothetical protein